MKAVLLWCLGSAAVITFGLIVKPLSGMAATGLLLAGGVALIVAICRKDS